MTTYQIQLFAPPLSEPELCVILWLDDTDDSVVVSTSYKNTQPTVTHYQQTATHLIQVGSTKMSSHEEVADAPAIQSNHIHFTYFGEEHTFTLRSDLSVIVQVTQSVV